MPKLSLRPLSVLAGVAVAGLVLLTSSQMPLLPTGFRIENLPHPRGYVQIKEGTPYTVPVRCEKAPGLKLGR